MTHHNTLIVKHLPSELTSEDVEELLHFFGAKKIRVLPSWGKLKCVAFAVFATHQQAKHALLKLHQREILNRRLVVEFAQKQDQHEFPKESDFSPLKPKDTESTTKISDKEKLRLEAEEFSKQLHGMCPALGLDYLPSPLLKYKYPEPTPSIIANISHALVSVPKFYTQVLHLMNKMNLPAPFGPVTPSPPLAPEAPVQEIPSEYRYEDVLGVEEMDTGSEESELESEEENVKATVLPMKRPMKKIRKKPKLQLLQLVLPSKLVDSRTEPSDVFESHAQLDSQKKIQFNIKQSLDNEEINAESVPSDEKPSGFGVITAPKTDKPEGDTEGKQDETWDEAKFISLKELKRKRVSSHEMKTISVFRNYSPGEPTVRLYVKNLARQVVEKDLRYIFGRFVNRNSETERNMFDIRLMQEGRMKGQAFVTFPSEKQAIEAVKETNGFVLHTKPLVVQFARSAKPKEAPNKQTKK